MTNRIALILAIAVITAIALDFALLGGAVSLFLGRKLVVLIDWAMFWR